MDIRKLFPGGKFLKYDDLVGSSYVTAITSAKHEIVDASWGKDHRIVLELEPDEDNPNMPCAVSASKRLAREIAEALAEPDFSKWVGHTIEFVPKEIQAFGKRGNVPPRVDHGSSGLVVEACLCSLMLLLVKA